MDLVLGAAVAIAAGVAALYHPEKTLLRAVLTVPALLIVPGYFLLQTVIPSTDHRPTRPVQGALAVGLSPPLVALIALATTLTPWGFQQTPIVLGVMFTSLVLVALTLYRRVSWASPSAPGEGSTGTR